MKRLGALGIAAAYLVWAGAAMAQVPNLSNQPAYTIPLPSYSGPFEASQGQVYLNNLVVSLNGLLSGNTGLQNGGGATTMLGAAASTGTGPIVLSPVSTPGQTEGANVGFAISSHGDGNITLFYGSQATSKGILQIGNATGWFPAKGLTACPGGGPSGSQSPGAVLQPSAQVIAGYEIHEDWMGRATWIPACRATANS